MSDNVRLQGFLQQDLVVAIVNITLKNLSHYVREISEEHAEIATKETSCHVESLLAIVVTIVLVDEPELGLNEFVRHVAQEERFLVHAIG